MNRIFFLICCALILNACGTKNTSEVDLFNGLTFKLNEGERVVSNDEKSVELINSFYEDSNIQLPLFRKIKSENYQLLIAIPFSTHIEELRKKNSSVINENIDLDSEDPNVFYFSNSQSNEYFTHYAESKENNLIYILAITDDKELSDSLFTKTLISKRIIQQ